MTTPLANSHKHASVGMTTCTACDVSARTTASAWWHAGANTILRLETFIIGKVRVDAGNLFYDYLMVFLWYRAFPRWRFCNGSSCGFNTATRESSSESSSAASPKTISKA